MRFILFIFSFIFATEKDINFHLNKNHSHLQSFYQEVKKQNRQKNYPIFRNRLIIEQKYYFLLDKIERKEFSSHIVLSAFYKTSQPLYSNFGGVSIDGILAEDKDDKTAKTYHYQFDGRYYTDLLNAKQNKVLYTYCILPSFKHCILLGIGEEW